ncbi:DUF2147 domain-containing protein [Acinetobacter variabilis]|uniref:DUF2147 domain-containing protein n=1 Tax=Acinetobacter variabilis TaxID=70346 RepID=UPI00254BCD40|nr:DUF2147 domain-containing protein [Acinetobacter variabilis]
MKKILSRLMMGITLATAAGLSFASEDPLLGKWKTIDDQSGYSRADVEIRKKPDGSYEGIIVETRSLPGAEKLGICSQCPGQLKNKPFIGLPFIWDFKADPKKPREFHDGKILDPISGKVYKGKARLSANGKRLTLRGYVGVSVIGRSVTWIKY